MRIIPPPVGIKLHPLALIAALCVAATLFANEQTADETASSPPVGLATFAASAISGEDSIATGLQGSVYALRTVILPFIWIFNPQLLLIGVLLLVLTLIIFGYLAASSREKLGAPQSAGRYAAARPRGPLK